MLGYIDAKPKVGYFAGPEGWKEKAELAPVAERKVREVMGVPIVLRDTATVGDAVIALFLENVGNLTIVDASGSLTGIVSRKDLLKATYGNPQSSSMPLSMVMTRYPNIVTASPDETVREAMGKMIAHEVDGLPVVQKTEAGGAAKTEVLGRITKTTVVKLLYDAMQ